MNIFKHVQVPHFKRTAFDLSHTRVMSLRMGKLIPFLCTDVVPGDSFSCSSEVFLRFAPLVAPVMHKVNVYTHFWFVPNRLVYSDWQDYISGGEDGHFAGEAPYYITSGIGTPYTTRCATSSLWDYLGLPILSTTPNASNAVRVSALPFRSYQLIYNEFYRDENLVPKLVIPKTGGNVTSEFSTGVMGVLRTRAWEKDYFTSSLPHAEKGDPMTIPILGNAVVQLDGSSSNRQQVIGNGGAGVSDLGTNGNGDLVDNATQSPMWFDPNGTLFANLQNVTSATINELRKAFQIQRFEERQMRTGSRYNETIMGHFGIKPSDARLQLPEYLGGGKANVVISEVLQQSQTTTGADASAQGTMTGHAVSFGKSNRFKAFFEEHGWIIGIMSVMPQSVYSQSLPRKFVRLDKFEYLWPELVSLGEQEVRNHEVYYTGSNSDRPMQEFGYQGRYNEYRYIPSSIHGDMHTSLLDWTLARKFSSLPSLNQDFIECKDASLNGIFNVTDQNVDNLYCQIDNSIVAKRPLPFLADPGGISL